MNRHDYAFPFRIDAAARQAARAPYEAHVAQMIRQVLLTTPGERVNLPEFGCGLRRLLFAPHTEALDATTKLIVRQALDRWLGLHITVSDVVVQAGETGTDESQLYVRIDYVLRETGGARRLDVRLT